MTFRDFEDKVDLSDELVKFLDGPIPPASVLVPKGKGQAAQAAAAAAAARAAAVAAAVADVEVAQQAPQEQTVQEGAATAAAAAAATATRIPISPAPVSPLFAHDVDNMDDSNGVDPQVGSKIKVYSRERRGWKVAFITSELPSGLHTIEYLDAKIEQVDFTQIRWQLIQLPTTEEGHVVKIPMKEGPIAGKGIVSAEPVAIPIAEPVVKSLQVGEGKKEDEGADKERQREQAPVLEQPMQDVAHIQIEEEEEKTKAREQAEDENQEVEEEKEEAPSIEHQEKLELAPISAAPEKDQTEPEKEADTCENQEEQDASVEKPSKQEKIKVEKEKKVEKGTLQMENDVAAEPNGKVSTAEPTIRSSSRLARRTATTPAVKIEPPPPPVEIVAPLKYKARLARDDGVERARQLTRSLKSLFPNVKPLFGESKHRSDLDATMVKIASKGAPEITYKGTWWESLPKILHWAQNVIDGAPAGKSATDDAAKTVTFYDNTVEIDRAALHAMGLFPDSWPAPFEANSLKKANAKAAQERGHCSIIQKGSSIEDKEKATNGKNKSKGSTAAASKSSIALEKEQKQEKEKEEVKEVEPPPPPQLARENGYGNGHSDGGAYGRHRSSRRSRNSGEELMSLPDVVIPSEVQRPKRKPSTAAAAGTKKEKSQGNIVSEVSLEASEKDHHAEKDPKKPENGEGVSQVAKKGLNEQPKGDISTDLPVVVVGHRLPATLEAKQQSGGPSTGIVPSMEPTQQPSEKSADHTKLPSKDRAIHHPPDAAPDAAALVNAPALLQQQQEPEALAAPVEPAPIAVTNNNSVVVLDPPALSVDAIQLLVTPRSREDQLAGDTFPHPPSATLPPLTLPKEVVPWGPERLTVAVNHVLAIAKAHRGRWVSPQRLVTLAQQSFSKRGLKEIALAQAAMAYLGNTTYDGWAVHRVEHSEGGMYYLTEEVPTLEETSAGNGTTGTAGALGGNATLINGGGAGVVQLPPSSVSPGTAAAVPSPATAQPVVSMALPTPVAVSLPVADPNNVAVGNGGNVRGFNSAMEAGPQNNNTVAASAQKAIKVKKQQPQMPLPEKQLLSLEEVAVEPPFESVVAVVEREEDMQVGESPQAMDGISGAEVEEELRQLGFGNAPPQQKEAATAARVAMEIVETDGKSADRDEKKHDEDVDMVDKEDNEKQERGKEEIAKGVDVPAPSSVQEDAAGPDDVVHRVPNGKEAAATTPRKVDVADEMETDGGAENSEPKAKSTTLFKLRFSSAATATATATATGTPPPASGAPEEAGLAPMEEMAAPLPDNEEMEQHPQRPLYPGALPATHAGQPSTFLPHAHIPRTQRTQGQQQAVDEALALVLTPVVPPAPVISPNLPPEVTPPAPPQLPPWMHLQPGADIPVPLAPPAAKAQVSRDLHHLFTAVLRVYAPQVAKLAIERAAAMAGERAATRVLKLKQLPEEVQVLRDTKHFEKVCSGETPTSKELPGPPKGTLRLYCKLAMPPELATPAIAPTRFGRKFLPVDPPAELISLPKDATLGDFMEATTELYRGMYRMCANFTAMDVVSGLQAPSSLEIEGTTTTAEEQGSGHLPNGNTKTIPAHSKAPPPKKHVAKAAKQPLPAAWDPSMPLAPLIPKEPLPIAAALAIIAPSGGGSIVGGHHHPTAGGGHVSGTTSTFASGSGPLIPTVFVAGVGLDTSDAWLHAGGPEDWIVACSCGTRDDDGEAMVACDYCGIWYHTRCVEVPDDCPSYVCVHCQKRANRIILH